MKPPTNKSPRSLIRAIQKDGKLKPADGGGMPSIKEGAEIGLSVANDDFEEPADLERFATKTLPISITERLATFEVVAIREEEDWGKLVEALAGFPEVKLIEPRLGALLGSGNLTIAIERQYIDKDFRDTFSAYFSKRFHTPSPRCSRLHFFRGLLTPLEILGRTLPDGAGYLGYSVLSPIHTGGLGRTLLASHLVTTRNSEHLHAKLCKETVNLLGRDHTVEGFPYISQDTEVAVCAQASLWMIVRYFSNRYPNYREIGPHQLANLVADFTLGRVFPSQGLEVWQASEILRRLGFHPVIHERKTFEDDAGLAKKLGFKSAEKGFEHLFYTYIESGIPLLVAYQDHAVVAFGHISDYRQRLEKEDASTRGFFHSSAWNRRFLIHDDARLPYQFMESDGDDSNRGFDKVRAFIAPMPEKTFLSADEYHRLAYELLDSEKFGTETNTPPLAKAIENGEIVLRSFLTTGSSLKRSITDRNISPELVEAYLHYSLPHFVWITEIHLLAKYPENCIGQIVWDATSSARDANGFLFVHYPDVLFMNTTPHFNRVLGPRPKDVIDLRLQEPLDVFTTFRPFSRNLSNHSPDHGSEKNDRS